MGLCSNIITTIPVYNGEKFIRQTLESVARQTLPPDRVIVLDNQDKRGGRDHRDLAELSGDQTLAS